MTSSRRSSDFDPRAEALFFAHQNRVHAGAPDDFESLCDAHPEFASDLRRMRALTEFAARGLPSPFSVDGSAATELGSTDEDVATDSALFERLRARSARSERYRILDEVARGGMGAILRIRDDELRRTLAMKVVLAKSESPGNATPIVDPKTIGRFLEEAQITGQLDHPGIVPVHELGLDSQGRVYFTMKLVRGEDLKTVFEHVKTGNEGWSQVRALNVILRVCEAVAFAHSKKVVHRDLKPSNVMVGKFGEVYVMDWGLARVLGSEDKHDLRVRAATATSTSAVHTDRRDQREYTPDSPLVTMDGDVVGTPSYMPPEQARGELDRLGPHSDVYSIGAMLYQLVTGRVPYVPDGGRVSAYALLMRVREGAPLPVREFAPRAPEELLAIVEKAMAREIADRYRDTVELAADLRAYVEGRVVRAYETGAWAETRKWVQRNKPLATALAATVIATLVGAGLFAWKASEASQKANDVLALSAQHDLDELVLDAARLWPADATMISKYEDWLRRARAQIDGQPADSAKGARKRLSLAEHKSKLEELRRDAKPLTASQILADRESHPRFAELQLKEAELLRLTQLLGRDVQPTAGEFGDPAQLLRARDELASEVDALRVWVNQRRTYEFDDPEEVWWNRQLAKLVLDLEALRDPVSGLMNDVSAAPFGWGVAKRYEFAKTIAERSTDGPTARRLWDDAIEAIKSSPKYDNLVIKPQLGLLPLGPDPDSQLWEFAHLQTGEPAVRGADRKLELTERTGLVFVLLPGGTFAMGAQSGEPSAPNFDEHARSEEGPVQKVELSPFFLSKYEMTQGQWRWVTAANPSGYQTPDPLAPSLLHPVEQVSWRACFQLMHDLGLTLPSEAQWEYGARAGTTTVWWTGQDRESLRGKVNIADQAAKKWGSIWAAIADWPDLDDGSVVHWKVGENVANQFGLHNVAGNVHEWCLDSWTPSLSGKDSRKDPVVFNPDSRAHVYRGGGFYDAASFARSGFRHSFAPDFRVVFLGVRPARPVTP